MKESRILRWLYKLIWYHWYKGERIIAVRGWRTALSEKVYRDKNGKEYPGQRQLSSPVFWWE